MDATDLRASAQAVTLATSATAAATTNGPSSSGAIAGGGPVPAPTQPTLLGVKLLPAPAGTPQTIHLNDGSMLVPLAKVGGDGVMRPLSAGGGPTAAPAVAAARTSGVPAANQGVPATAESKGFLYRGNYYKKFQDKTAIDIANLNQVHEKVTRGTLDHVKDEEPGWKGFGVTDVDSRAVNAATDGELLNVDPDAKYYVEVKGVTGTGEQKIIPSVVESDGDVYVDPRLRNG